MMIIDMGGGTVDMTVHDVDSSLSGGSMSMSEATHRECLAEVGDLCRVRLRLCLSLTVTWQEMQTADLQHGPPTAV